MAQAEVGQDQGRGEPGDYHQDDQHGNLQPAEMGMAQEAFMRGNRLCPFRPLRHDLSPARFDDIEELFRRDTDGSAGRAGAHAGRPTAFARAHVALDGDLGLLGIVMLFSQSLSGSPGPGPMPNSIHCSRPGFLGGTESMRITP